MRDIAGLPKLYAMIFSQEIILVCGVGCKIFLDGHEGVHLNKNNHKLYYLQLFNLTPENGYSKRTLSTAHML